MKLTLALHATIRHHNKRFMDTGLYGDAKIRFGNRVSEFGNRNRRKFSLNLQNSSLHSPLLHQKCRLRVTTNVLKRMDALGGLDNYIMGQRVMEGLKAEWLKKAMVLQQWRDELEQKGIPLKYDIRRIRMKQ